MYEPLHDALVESITEFERIGFTDDEIEALEIGFSVKKGKTVYSLEEDEEGSLYLERRKTQW